MKIITFTYADSSTVICRASDNPDELIPLGIAPSGMYFDVDVKKEIPSRLFMENYTITESNDSVQVVYKSELDRLLSVYIKGAWD